MNKAAKKTAFTLAITVVLGILVVGSFMIWLYSGKLTSAKMEIFSSTSLPLALINNQPLTGQSLFIREQLAAKLNPGQQVQAANIFNQIINETQIAKIASDRGVYVSPEELKKAYSDYADQENFSGQAKFEDLLAADGLNRQIFIEQVVEPLLVLAKLQTWFYSQNSLNQAAYKQASGLLGQIQNGQDMGILAKQFSQDSPGADLEGDLGFIQISRLLPEMQEGIDSLAVGQAKILPSRFGLNIVRLEGKSGNLLHLRQIYIKASSFDAWLAGQKQNFKIIKFINI